MHCFNYSIERTNNRTSSASFKDDGVLIRLAGRLSEAEEQRHVTSLLRRMVRRCAHHQASRTIDPFRLLLRAEGHFSIALADGTRWIFSVMKGERTSATRTENGWNIARAQTTGEKTFHAYLWRLLSMSEREAMEERVRTINAATFGARITRVQTRHMLSRFGSCAPNGRITLNTALLFVPEQLCTYVIIHELAHILHHNHSRAFWYTVASVLPDCMERRKALKLYRLRG